MEIHFLGTGAGVPSTQRNVSSTAIRFIQQKGRIWLFDCGEATQHQILPSPIKLSKIDKIFITHLHGDHIFGLPGLLGSRSFQGGITPLTVYGPKGIKQYLETALIVSHTHLTYELCIEEVEEGSLFVEEELSVSAYQLDHVMPCFGYRVMEREKSGPLDVARLKNIGISPGPIYKELKEGKRVTLPDGTVIEGKDFIGKGMPGRTIAIAGDTKPCLNVRKLAQQATVLIHEATFREAEAQLAHQFGHSTTKDAATTALEANVQTLLLTHISSRYHGQEMEIAEETRKYFPNTNVAFDSYIFQLSSTSE